VTHTNVIFVKTPASPRSLFSGLDFYQCLPVCSARDPFPGDPWIHFCSGYYQVNLSFNESNVLLKMIEGLL